jgi:hypothetical protein
MEEISWKKRRKTSAFSGFSSLTHRTFFARLFQIFFAGLASPHSFSLPAAVVVRVSEKYPTSEMYPAGAGDGEMM